MKLYSLIIDNFFTNPEQLRKQCDELPMTDHLASDGVVYPGIVEFTEDIKFEIENTFREIYDDKFDPQLTFGRYSIDGMKQPHWAHSDGNMAEFLGIIYLFKVPLTNSHGTYILKHIEEEFELHPRTEHQKHLLLSQTNDRDKWEKTYYCPAKYNRLFILNSDYIHAPGDKFGSDRVNGRFIISTFFNLKN